MDGTPEKYFKSLKINSIRDLTAPHKPILLLSIIDLIESGDITTNTITLSKKLEKKFYETWDYYIGTVEHYKPRLGTPFWHLHSEWFWKLIPYEGGEGTIEALKPSNELY